MIGILGDGQLALMLGEAAEAQKIDFLAFGADEASSFAVRFPDRFVKGASTDLIALTNFARRCTVLTLENEFLPADSLHLLETTAPVRVIPDSKSYSYFESKISQRTFYRSLGILGPQWEIVSAPVSVSSVGFPCVVKANQGGYDGYGVRVVETQEEFEAALRLFGWNEGRSVLVEEKVEVAGEYAQGALMDGKGGMLLLPLVETVQRNGICELVLTRPRLDDLVFAEVSLKIKTALKQIAQSGLHGLFNFEFFLTHDGSVLINEGAPRPHNSQHVTLDACDESQFSILMAYLASGQMEEAEIAALPAAMINLLGKSKGTHYALSLPELPSILKVYPKLYLKKECRPGRKMGHLNLVDPSDSLDLVYFGEKILKEYQL